MDLLRTQTLTLSHSPPWTQGADSLFLSLHFPAVYFGQLVARSHSAAVPMVIATEIAIGVGEGGSGVTVAGLTESERDSGALFEEIGGLFDCRGGGRDAELGGRCAWDEG